MSGGGAKGGPQAVGQQTMGGGKGGMNQNLRGPAGNAQNNPGGPQANYGMGMNPMQGFANMNKLGQGLGSAGAYGQPTLTPVGQSLPPSNLQSMMQFQPYNPGMFDFSKFVQSFGGGNKPVFGGGLDTSGMTPISANLTPPTPQPQEPVGGYINGQPAQFHYQAEALKNPPPRTTAAGLPAGGILAKLYGG